MAPTPTDVPRYPHGVPAWMDLLTAAPGPAAEFYGHLFGWRFRELDDAPGPYRVASLPDGDVAGIGALAIGNPGWTMYVRVDELDATERRVLDAGGLVREPSHEAFDGGRRTRFEDPAGAVFGAWQGGRHDGADVVNVANSWNFNELHTPDPEAAAEFYGNVFGWETTEVGPDLLMVRRPGYSDVLEQRNPGTLARHAEAGAPPSFSDAVGWIVATAEGTPRWNVTFAVADPDGVAARARELGGSVAAEPFDVDDSRVAELVDPQGFPFTVSRYGPT
ncbi:VOC family protein [Georgenia sp. EYE_87]|uniref:VOC family protein n=1 Tax=Georgenia sp. EYE_87 TaxID=2853448 RepID=UPI0020052035|nr:VOC family protein [Georgenia sp. EYE_87]MCK6212245.1 VOC family protein [Georgenia sp. EYE_87]